MPGIGDKLSSILGLGGNVQPVAASQPQQLTNLAQAGFPGAQQMTGDPPAAAGPSSAYQAAYLKLVNAGVDPTEAAIIAQEQSTQQGPGPGTVATAGLADVGNTLLQAKLYPELTRGIQPQPVNVSAPGPLPFQGGPTPNSAITTASIIAELV